ncbi:hypothetical protein ACO22_06077 [Paracoccidioides brasiliensis]|uniref:Uncharacterized protein n=1 Tax=Paracoccidioides brasiliensis TaxID=121759 RepID=A0A1D2J8H6_PARBR|nr:hypothetical protein ACO22_06077 [Paracoccidioides brasiliensis]
MHGHVIHAQVNKGPLWGEIFSGETDLENRTLTYQEGQGCTTQGCLKQGGFTQIPYGLSTVERSECPSGKLKLTVGPKISLNISKAPRIYPETFFKQVSNEKVMNLGMFLPMNGRGCEALNHNCCFKETRKSVKGGAKFIDDDNNANIDSGGHNSKCLRANTDAT